MTNCEDCRRARNDLAGYRRFDPACLECGARYLWQVQRSPGTKEERVAWLRKILADWMEFGHPEQRLRELAKQDWKRWVHHGSPGL
jgi:transposase-like protein